MSYVSGRNACYTPLCDSVILHPPVLVAIVSKYKRTPARIVMVAHISSVCDRQSHSKFCIHFRGVTVRSKSVVSAAVGDVPKPCTDRAIAVVI